MTIQRSAITSTDITANTKQSICPVSIPKAFTRKNYRMLKQRFLGVLLALLTLTGCLVTRDATAAILLIPVSLWLIASKQYVLTDIKKGGSYNEK